MNSDELVLMLDAPVDVDEKDLPFGERWGCQLILLNSQHLTALQAGKYLALDVQNEYVVYLKQEEPNVRHQPTSR
jgi:hypothetical protein